MTTSLPTSTRSTWQLKPLICCIGFAFFLVISLFMTPFSKMWEFADLATFRYLNTPLSSHPALRTFWALANHHLADWFEDLCILAFFVAATFETKKEKRRKRIGQFVFLVMWIALTIILVNRLLCRDLFRLRRESPTILLPHAVNLLDYISWIQFKVNSSKSFPGDHATTALMFGFGYAYLVRGKLGLTALMYAFLLCLPRLAVGAHWLSDILVGSGSIVLFSLSLAFFSPFFNKLLLKKPE